MRGARKKTQCLRWKTRGCNDTFFKLRISNEQTVAVQFVTTIFDMDERKEKERERARARESADRGILIFSVYVYESVNIISFDGGSDALILENIFSTAGPALHEIYAMAERSHFSMSINVLVNTRISYY